MRLTNFESTFASNLKGFPRLYFIVSFIYKFLLYYISSKSASKVVLNTAGATLLDVAPHRPGETFFGYYERLPNNAAGSNIFLHKYRQKCSLIVESEFGDQIFEDTLLSWNYQQGCLASWLSEYEIVYNNVCGEKVVCHVVNLKENTRKVLKYSLQCVSISTRVMCSLDLLQLKKLRPDYSYPGLPDHMLDASKGFLTLSEIDSGSVLHAIPYEDIKNIAFPSMCIDQNFKINHCLFSPCGNYLIFLARAWVSGEKLHSFLLMSVETGKIKVLLRDEVISHYNWYSNSEVIFWGTIKGVGGYYTLDIKEFKIQRASSGFESDGHPTVLENGDFITDEYPTRNRMSPLVRYDSNELTSYVIAQFYQPLKFQGSKRVDLHPKVVSDKAVFLESGHSGTRRLYKLCL